MKNILIICLLGFTLFSCKPKIKETEETKEVVTIDSIYVEPETSTEEVKEVRYWSSTETKLPRGVVYAYDCSNRNKPPIFQPLLSRPLGCNCLRNSAVSRPIGATLPHAQHI
jgi:hypothetical protein